uniref:Uncharacterized protein n=1 Tax=Anguilla anguilla TaxID=7936 RepID=A0A0E9SVZ2_ANGAN
MHNVSKHTHINKAFVDFSLQYTRVKTFNKTPVLKFINNCTNTNIDLAKADLLTKPSTKVQTMR